VENNVQKLVEDFVIRFSSIVFEAMPFIIIGAIIAGLLEELVPQRYVAKFIPRNRVLAIAMGGLLGLIFPMCECGIIPIMRRLLRKGLPLSCCVCYMLAGPIINPVVMTSTFVAFTQSGDGSGLLADQMGPGLMVGLRVGLGFLVAFGTSLVVEWQYRKYGYKLLAPLAVPDQTTSANDEENNEAAGGSRRSFAQRLNNITETALHDFVDIMVFLILGAVLAAAVKQGLIYYKAEEQISDLAQTYPVTVIAVMMGLAILLCLCSEADAFVAASFRTLPSAAKLSFLVLGPMMDLKLYLMYTRIFRPRLIWTIISCVVVQVLFYSTITHFLWKLWLSQVAPDTSGPASP
jgi:hypothetical protein